MAITKENKNNVAKFNVVPLTSPALMDFPGLKGLNVKQRTLHMSMQHPHLAPKDVVFNIIDPQRSPAKRWLPDLALLIFQEGRVPLTYSTHTP